MLTLKRLAIYIITFLIALVLALSMGNWRKGDNYLVGYSNRTGEQEDIVNKDLVFVHVETKPVRETQCESFEQTRMNTINLLMAVANQAEINNGPKGVVLDIKFGKDKTKRQELVDAINYVQYYDIPVYGVYDINAFDQSHSIDDVTIEELETEHLEGVYDLFSEGTGKRPPSSGRYHTNFYFERDMASYENDVNIRLRDSTKSVTIESLVYKVVKDLGDSKTMLLDGKRRGSIVPYANITEMQMRSYIFVADSSLSIKSFVCSKVMDSRDEIIDLDEKIMIVGDPINDVQQLGSMLLPRPYVVTWAISDLLDANVRLNLPLENNKVIISQMLFFAFFVALSFALIFKYVKLLQTRPLIISVLSFLSAFLLLFIYYKLILTFKAVIPVGQTIVAMIVASGLCWRFAYKFLVTGIAEGSQKYDVFISYSHGNSDWVKKNVFEPLDAFRLPSGDKLKIFFDTKSIGIGEPFTSKYMWGIVDSKVFIPVISEDYYGKNHCKNEMDLAYKRSVEKLLDILPIAFSYEAVPEIYTHINFLDIKVDPSFIESVQKTIIELDKNGVGSRQS